MDINPHLNIQIKSDTPEKLLLVEGKPSEHYLFAREFNAIVRRLNFLRDLIDISDGDIEEIIATGVRLDFGVIESDIVGIINDQVEPTDLGTNGTTFLTFLLGEIKYVYVFVGTSGSYGYGDSLLTLADADLELLYTGSSGNVSEPYLYYKAKLKLNNNSYVVDVIETQNTIGFPQFLGMPDNIFCKWFRNLTDSDPTPWPADTHFKVSNIIRNNAVVPYACKTVAPFNDMNIKCFGYNFSTPEVSELFVEITVPNV